MLCRVYPILDNSFSVLSYVLKIKWSFCQGLNTVFVTQLHIWDSLEEMKFTIEKSGTCYD